MSFVNFLKKNRGQSRIVLFDVGSASVGGAVVSLSNGEAPDIKYCTRHPLLLQETINEKRYISQMMSTLEKVAQDIALNLGNSNKLNNATPDKIVCILASSWCTTQTSVVEYSRKEKFEVTEKIMDDLLKKIREKVSDVNTTKKDDSVIMEEATINSVLNGYITKEPIGKKAKSLSVTFLRSEMKKDTHSKMTTILEKNFGSTDIIFQSFSLASFSTIRDVFDSLEDFLLIDVTGEITDIIVTKKGSLSDIVLFPYGKNTLIRNTAKASGSIPEETHSRIKMHLSGEITGKTDFASGILEQENQWAELFGKACAELSDLTLLPNNVFLITDQDFSSWFTRLIERVDFNQFTVTSESFKVISIQKDQFKGLYSSEKGMGLDIFLIIDSLFYNRVHMTTG